MSRLELVALVVGAVNAAVAVVDFALVVRSARRRRAELAAAIDRWRLC